MSFEIRVVVADEHRLYREALSKLLLRNGFSVVGAADTPAELMAALAPAPLPDIAIISYKTTRPSTLTTARWLKEHYPQVKVLVITLFNNLLPLNEFSRSGIEGVVIKSHADPMQIVSALQAIHRGKVFYAG
ncbi:MAG TPA: response regulator transcription factor [Chitinophagaceae bacterium]|nr:response regulator transcription factor [Chitinophagaceae bacterium]